MRASGRYETRTRKYMAISFPLVARQLCVWIPNVKQGNRYRKIRGRRCHCDRNNYTGICCRLRFLLTKVIGEVLQVNTLDQHLVGRYGAGTSQHQNHSAMTTGEETSTEIHDWAITKGLFFGYAHADTHTDTRPFDLTYPPLHRRRSSSVDKHRC